MKKIFLFIAIILAMNVYSQTEYNVSASGGDNTGRGDVGVILTTAIANGETVFRFTPGRYKIITGVDFPNGSALIIDRGALLDVKDTLTGYNTAIEAGDYQIFTRASNLDGSWEIDEFPISWFGALGDGNNISIELDAAAAFSILKGESL